MLKVEKLEIHGLPPLTFSVAPGECFAIEGPSGAGKTRLLRAIADLDPAAGYVYLDGVERNETSAPQWRRSVRYCPSEPGWWAATLAEHAPAWPPAKARFERLLEQLDVPNTLLSAPIDELSTGERQRTAIALALADEPRVLLLDEPTGMLDGPRAALVEELIRYQLLSARMVLLVSHDRGQIERLSDSRLLLARPPVSEADAPSDLDDGLVA